MAITLTAVGIQSTAAIALCESIDYDKKMDEALILECDGGFGAAEAYDPTIDWSIKGSGDLPALLIIGTDGSTDAALTDINDGSGTNLITSVKETESNEDFNSWDVSGTYFPGAI